MDRRPRRRHRARPAVERLDDRQLLSGLTPAQVTKAYGLDAITFADGTVRGDGSGQTIALIEAYDNPYLASDVRAFSARLGLADPQITIANLGATATDDGWASESAMDAEWAHAIAPGANLLVVEAASEGMDDLLAAVDFARHAPGVSAVSMSWGFPEFPGETQYDGLFTTPSGHQGVTFLTASGDSGSWHGAEWPSASPNVVSVGGTSLHLDASGGIAGESAWIDGGGGLSSYESTPWYQASLGVPMRSTPDVAFVADPQTGAAVYYTTPSTGVAKWATIGGTSLGAPAWAGIVAIVDQGLALAGKTSLDGASQTLPTLYGIASAASANGGDDFRAVASTTSTTGGGTTGGGHRPIWPGGYLAAGSSVTSTATGLGTPGGTTLVHDMVATPLATVAAPPSPAPTAPTATAPASPKKKKHKAPPRKKKAVKKLPRAKAHAHAVSLDALDAAIEALA